MTTQAEFASERSTMSQTDKILAQLRYYESGYWIPMPVLVRVSGGFAVHSRIADLRKRGHAIQCKITRKKNGAKASFYRFAPPLTAPENCLSSGVRL